MHQGILRRGANIKDTFPAIRRLRFAIMAAALGVSAADATHPVKLARFVQINIQADAAVDGLDDGWIVRGNGWVNRMPWLPETQRPLSYFTGIDINRLIWTRVGFEFTPVADGKVTIGFSGPWEEVEPGVVWRQEVAIDGAGTSGGAAPFINGGFETLEHGTPKGWVWSDPPGEMTAANPPPTAGDRSAIVWTGNMLSQTVAVTGGIPVRVWVHARARTPEGFEEPPRLPSSGTPAHEAIMHFMRGVNLANALEAPPGEDWGAHYTNADFDAIAAQGFDHVRIPAAWHYHTGPAPDYAISNAFFAKVDALVTNALARDLHAIVNIHHFHDFTSDPERWAPKFYALWEQIAAHYRDTPDTLAFELLNEPTDAATTEVMNPIYAQTIARIRPLAPDRPIFVGPGDYNRIAELEHLILPASESNLIVTVHDYEPFYFTHQGAHWTLPDTATTGIVYPGPPPEPVIPHPDAASNPGVADWFERYNRLETGINPCSRDAWRDALAYARAWSDWYGRPVHVGEWGCYRHIDPESRRRFHRQKREDLDAHRLPWAIWDWKAEFRYWDPEAGIPKPGLREAILPAPMITRIAFPRVTVSGSVGRRYRWETTGSLTGAPIWDATDTERLTDNRWERIFDTAPTNRFIRVRWLPPRENQ